MTVFFFHLLGRFLCKRHAPFPLAEHAWVDSNGNWGPRCLDGMMNNWVPTIMDCVRSNHDCKLITNGAETRHITFYFTNYTAKHQQRSSNTSALVANTLAFHKAHEAKNTDLQALNQKLIQRCANSLSRDQEFSAPEVVSYLMNWGDRYISHHFEPIYISSVIAMLKQMFPQLDHRDEREEEEHKDDNVSVHENDHSEFHDALYRLNWQCWKSQIRESICEITSKNMSIEEMHSKIIRSSISSSTLMTHQK